MAFWLFGSPVLAVRLAVLVFLPAGLHPTAVHVAELGPPCKT